MSTPKMKNPNFETFFILKNRNAFLCVWVLAPYAALHSIISSSRASDGNTLNLGIEDAELEDEEPIVPCQKNHKAKQQHKQKKETQSHKPNHRKLHSQFKRVALSTTT